MAAIQSDDENNEGFDIMLSNQNAGASSAQPAAEEEGFALFKSRQARGTLYKLSPMTDETKVKMTAYVHGGSMAADLRYAREIYGLINTSGRRDFSYVWESPWVEEHVRDTAKKRKLENQQRAMAVRSFLKASSTHDTDNIERFITNVDTLTRWEDKYDSKEDVKTISRIIQSFERVAVRNIWTKCQTLQGRQYSRVMSHLRRLNDNNIVSNEVTTAANSLRRANGTFDLFANLVATEINWADSTNGTKNLSIYQNKQLDQKKETAMLKLMTFMETLSESQLAKDEVGNPLMEANFNICVSHGVLVVGQPSNEALYVLDIEGNRNSQGHIDLTGIKTINITQTLSESDVQLSSVAMDSNVT